MVGSNFSTFLNVTLLVVVCFTLKLDSLVMLPCLNKGGDYSYSRFSIKSLLSVSYAVARFHILDRELVLAEAIPELLPLLYTG